MASSHDRRSRRKISRERCATPRADSFDANDGSNSWEGAERKSSWTMTGLFATLAQRVSSGACIRHLLGRLRALCSELLAGEVRGRSGCAWAVRLSSCCAIFSVCTDTADPCCTLDMLRLCVDELVQCRRPIIGTSMPVQLYLASSLHLLASYM